MIKQIKDKMLYAALAIPAFAADAPVVGADVPITISSDKVGAFSGLTNVTIGSFIGWLIGLIFIITSIIFFFILIFGGVKWITSGGDEKKVAAARASITSALVGLAIVFASWAIMKLLGSLLGFDIFNLSIKALV